MLSIVTEVQNGNLLVLDGEWRKQLFRKGLKPGACSEFWNMTHCDDVMEIAKESIDAGADIILTNSFAANFVKLAYYELEAATPNINIIAAQISKEVAGENHYVLGSIGPTGKKLNGEDINEEEIYDGFCIQAKSLVKGGADALCVESMNDSREAELAVRAVKETTEYETICTFAFKEKSGGYFTADGVSLAEAIETVKEAGADIIGSSCCNGMDGMIDIVSEIRNIDSTTPVLVHADSDFSAALKCCRETPEQIAEKAMAVIEAGANIIGCCCSSTVEQISAVVNWIRDQRNIKCC